MADKKERAPQTTSSKGSLLWPFLTKPDMRWDKEKGEYKTTLVLPAGDPWVEEIEGLAKAGYEEITKAVKPAERKDYVYVSPFKPDKDANGKETGNVLVNFKTKAKYKSAKTGEWVPLTPKIFDAQGKLLQGKLPSIGNGTIARVNGSYKSLAMKNEDKRKKECWYEVYFSLYLNAVQIVKLVEFAASADSFGFGEEEGGFDGSTFNADAAGVEQPGADEEY
jgi:hypothetical protein